MSASYHTQRRIQWADTDAAGIAHFTAFFRYMEEVEHEFLRAQGLSVVGGDGERAWSWPRVSVRCDYHGPVRFEDVLEIELAVTRVGEKSVTYEFSFSHDGRHVAAGATTAVCCRIESGRPPVSVAIPEAFLARLRAAGA